jgi:HK97 family phage major capsid protein
MKLKFKIGDKEVEYDFKHINIPEKDHGLDDGSLALLMKIDEGLVKSKEGIVEKKNLDDLKKEMYDTIETVKKDFNYEKLQEQLNAIFVYLEEKGLKPSATPEERKFAEKQLNQKWLRAMLKKDESKMREAAKEIKQRFQSAMEPIMHLGPSTDEIDVDYSQGGYLVPTLFTNEIYRFAEQGGIARREFAYMPFVGAGNTRDLHRLLTNVTVGWVDEGEEKPKTKPTTAKVQQTLKTLAAITIFTEDIVEDAAVDLISFCSQLLGEAIAAEEDNQFFSGTGAPWTGIINDAAIVHFNLAAGVGPLDMRPESLLALTVAIPVNAVPGAKFYMHRSVWAAICARRSDAVAAGDTRGMYLVQQPSQGSPGTVWGYPVVLVEAMPSLTDLGYANEEDTECDPEEPFIIFGNLGKCVIYGDKKGLRVRLLDQASVYDDEGNLINLAERDMLALRVHKRVGYVTILPAGIAVLETGSLT